VRNMKKHDIVVVADPQTDATTPTDHLEALSRYIWEHKPGTVVHIGDHWDFPALSSYASQKEIEGARLADDLEGGKNAFLKIMGYVHERNRLGKRVPYLPALHFCKGNHENRLERYISNNIILEGLIDIDEWIGSQGWTVHQMCVPLFIQEICFIHYLENSQSGRPVGGSIDNKLNKFPHSFVHGHQQFYQFGRRQNLLGKPHFGVCAGSFYMHDEGYRGSNNTEVRGFVHLKHYRNRYGYDDYDVDFVALERLLAEY